MGRPRIPITERDKQQIQTLAGLGMTLDKIALVLNISPRTLDRWLKHDEVLALFQKGCALAEQTIAKTLFEKARDGDMTAIIWYERTRCGRTEKAEVKHTGNTSPVQIFLPDNGRDVHVVGGDRSTD